MGKYTVTVKFKGNYGGTEKLNFTIVPAKVTGVKFSATSTTAVKLTWNAVSGAAVYRIYRYNTSTKKYDTIALVRGATVYSNTGLKAGSQYKYIVRAYGEADDNYIAGSPSDAITAATKPATPTLKVASNAKNKATLTWSNVAGESGYEVYYSTSKSSGYKKYGTAKANKTSATLSKLTSGKTYYFRVRAYVKTANGTAYGGYKTVAVKVK